MSDGGREPARDTPTNTRTSKSSTGGEFGRALSRVVVSQILESSGFHSSLRSPIDALAHILIRYVCGLGKAAVFHTNLAGRTGCDVFDVIQALEDLGALQGFSGASDVHRCLAGSGVVREIAGFVNSAKEAPFALSVPRFPVPRSPKTVPSFAELGKEPGGEHIPVWLPAFPDPLTYIHSPPLNERTTLNCVDKIEQARQRRKVERSLLNLQWQLGGCGSDGSSPAIDDDIGKGKQAIVSNPFLAPPLLHGEKEVSEIPTPSEAPKSKRLSVVETFAPAIEAVQSGRLDPRKGVVPDRRGRVCFRLGVDRKSVAVALSSRNLDAHTSSWFPREDEKDDKKRRAEMILKEAMENPQQLAQL